MYYQYNNTYYINKSIKRKYLYLVVSAFIPIKKKNVRLIVSNYISTSHNIIIGMYFTLYINLILFYATITGLYNGVNLKEFTMSKVYPIDKPTLKIIGKYIRIKKKFVKLIIS